MLPRRLCGGALTGAEASLQEEEEEGGVLPPLSWSLLLRLCRIRAGGCDLPILKMKEKNWLNLLQSGSY